MTVAGAIAKLVRLLGLDSSGRATRNKDHGRPKVPCEFPGCGRAFADTTSLTLHARTHTDGDRTAFGTGEHTDAASTAAATKNVEGSPRKQKETAPGETTGPLTTVFVGPMEHHS